MSDLSDRFNEVIDGEEFNLRGRARAELEYLQTLDRVSAVRDNWVNRLIRSGLVNKVIITEDLLHHYQRPYCNGDLAIDPFEGKLSFDETERLIGGLYLADLRIPRPHNCGQIFLYERLGSALLPANGYDAADVVLVADAVTNIRSAADYYSLRLDANSTIPGPGSITPSHIFDPD